MHTLSAAHSLIGDGCAQAISESYYSDNLRSLDLSNCKLISPAGWKKIADGLPKLRSFGAQGTHITPEVGFVCGVGRSVLLVSVEQIFFRCLETG